MCRGKKEIASYFIHDTLVLKLAEHSRRLVLVSVCLTLSLWYVWTSPVASTV